MKKVITVVTETLLKRQHTKNSNLKRFQYIQLPVEPLNYFLSSNTSNINQNNVSYVHNSKPAVCKIHQSTTAKMTIDLFLQKYLR